MAIHGHSITDRTKRTSKEVARHVLHRIGVKRRLPYLAHDDVGDRFVHIYNERVWAREDDQVPGSGFGSTIEATAAIRTELPKLFNQLGSEVVLDLGCGDFAWMDQVVLDQQYHGVDIVPEVITANQQHYASDRRQFYLANAASDKLPDADTVLCRELLFHLSFDDIRATMQNLLSKKRRYLIATTDSISFFNSDVDTGDFRFLNLQRPPFRFGKPMLAVADPAVSSNRVLGVWPTDNIRTAMRL